MDKKLPDTEKTSNHNDIEKMTLAEMLTAINQEDQTVPDSVATALPQLMDFVQATLLRMQKGGRLFYIGSGTSGRLGIVDASECPPTFGVSPDVIVGIIAGGDGAIRKAVEFAEDDKEQGWQDLLKHDPSELDTVLGIAASGTTPYVIGAVQRSRENGLLTGCLTCNTSSPLAGVVERPIEVPVGPEFITGSTRMKSGTAQKLVLNMISTALMIKLGHVKGNRMINMQLTNKKLEERGIRMLREQLGVSDREAQELLVRYDSVKEALANHKH